MLFGRHARTAVAILGAGLVLVMPGWSADARSKQEPQAVEPPAPIPPAPVGLPAAMISDAAAYEAYLERVTAISASFSSPPSVASALRLGAAYEPKALVRGAIAYAAIAALRNPTFVADVRAMGNSPESRAQMASYFISNPAYAFSFKGADVSAGLAKAALGDAGLRLFAAGKAVKQSAYDVQHQAWSKAEVADRSGRLSAVEAESAAPIAPAEDRVPAMQQALSGGQPAPADAKPAQPPYTPLLGRVMQLAGMAALGEATDAAYDHLSALAEEGITHNCLHMAKLNLFQCLAVAKPNYEDIFCIGQHVMMDSGRCLAVNAGMEMPSEIVTPRPAAAPATPAKARKSGRG